MSGSDPNPGQGDLERGVTLHRAGRLDEAKAAYEAALAAAPGDPNALHLLGRVALDSGQPLVAESLLREAVAAAPAPGFLHTLGLCLIRLGRDAEAAEILGKAATADPKLAPAHLELGLALRRLGRLREAMKALFTAVELLPEDMTAASNLGLVLLDLDMADKAIPLLERAAARSPGTVALHTARAMAEMKLRRFGAAVRHLEQALTLTPSDPVALGNLGLARQLMGDLEGALAATDHALEVMPRRADLWSNRLMMEQYRPGVTAASLARLHALYHTRIEAPLAAERQPRPVDKTRPLRVGYLSPDFLRHPVGHFLAAVLPHHDPARVAVTCYTDRPTGDSMTRRLKEMAPTWTPVTMLDNPALAARIEADGIDVLVDLAGHTAHNRLPVFARRPAPVQLTWAGYVGTTGLHAMDGLIADRWHVPESEEAAYGERIWRIGGGHGYVAYAPPPDMPAVAPLPAAANGVVTFGSFNAVTKINLAVAALWARVLDAVAGSLLVLKTDAFDDAAAADRIRAVLGAAGIGPERLVLLGQTAQAEHLAAYGRIDIALDPFPYSGGMTTLEALWMGVPVVTLTGATFAGRHSTSHLTVGGLAEACVATTAEDYVGKARALAGDLDALAALRGGLRARMEASPLGDRAGFTRALEDVFLAAAGR